MASIDQDRIDQLRARYGIEPVRRTTSVREAAARFRARAGDLAVTSKSARRRMELAKAPDGDALRKIYTRSIPRKG